MARRQCPSFEFCTTAAPAVGGFLSTRKKRCGTMPRQLDRKKDDDFQWLDIFAYFLCRSWKP
jgi:hypothetical protein